MLSLGARGGCFDIFPSSFTSFLSPFLRETARCRLKRSLNPNQSADKKSTDVLYTVVYYPPTDRFGGYSDEPGIRPSVSCPSL